MVQLEEGMGQLEEETVQLEEEMVQPQHEISPKTNDPWARHTAHSQVQKSIRRVRAGVALPEKPSPSP